MNAAAWNVSVLLATLFILTATDAESQGLGLSRISRS